MWDNDSLDQCSSSKDDEKSSNLGGIFWKLELAGLADGLIWSMKEKSILYAWYEQWTPHGTDIY